MGNNKLHKEKQCYIQRLKSTGCAICGYNKCSDALCFHHINPSLKSNKLLGKDASMSKLSWYSIINESEKSVVLCHNCHIEVHIGLHPEYLEEAGTVIKVGDFPEQLSLIEM